MLQYVICVICLALVVFLIIFCTCRLRRQKTVENDLLGVDGKVKIRNPDEIILESVENRISDNTHRSLPEIPVINPISTAFNSSNWANNEKNSGNDVASDLYATVATSYNVLGRTSSRSEQVPDNVNNSSENCEQPNNAIACSSQSIGVAASAISGGLIVNQDIPCIISSASERDLENFSGDSQDSSKGYTSISVREPLAQLRAQTIASNLNDVKHDYATVLDDDAVYAAIDEPENNSITYDQIDLNVAQREISVAFEEAIAQHTRTGSESSSNSLPAVKSLKKTEVRQTSPRIARPPTLPTVQLLTPNSSSLFLNVPSTSKNISDNNNNTNNNIEDMYAKVVKSTGKLNRNPVDNNIEYDQQIVKNDFHNRFHNLNNNECNYESVIDSYSMIGGSSLNSEGDPNYETVRQTHPNYESLIHIEPQYEKLKRKNSTDSNSTDTKND